MLPLLAAGLPVPPCSTPVVHFFDEYRDYCFGLPRIQGSFCVCGAEVFEETSYVLSERNEQIMVEVMEALNEMRELQNRQTGTYMEVMNQSIRKAIEELEEEQCEGWRECGKKTLVRWRKQAVSFGKRSVEIAQFLASWEGLRGLYKLPILQLDLTWTLIKQVSREDFWQGLAWSILLWVIALVFVVAYIYLYFLAAILVQKTIVYLLECYIPHSPVSPEAKPVEPLLNEP